MANDYRILDERDIKNFQAGNKLNVTEIDNKVTYEHIGEPPDRLPSKEQVLEYGKSFDITVPSVYDSTGHVKSETTYSFKMPDKVDTSSSLTADNFAANTPIRVNKNGNNITYSHDTSGIKSTPTEEEITPDDNNTISLTVLSAADGYGHATEQKTYKFKMPKAPESPDIPKVDKVTLTNDVTGTGTFSNGTCSISTTLKNLSDSSKYYGWKGDPVYNNIENNNENETFNPKLNWGSTIKVPNFLVDEKGRVQSGWTSKYTLPAAPTIPKVDKVKLTGAVTGEGSFSNGTCFISTTLKSKPVNTINITGAVTGTGTESSGNWTVDTDFNPQQWVESKDILNLSEYTTEHDVSNNILIAFYWNTAYNTTEESGGSVKQTMASGGIIVPVKLLIDNSRLTYPVTFLESSNNLGVGSLFVSYNYTTKQATVSVSTDDILFRNIKVYGLL